MLKGAQKRMVVLRMAADSLFETAYFVLRDDTAAVRAPSDDSMLREANRIIAESFSPGEVKRKKRRHTRASTLFWLLLGAALGATIPLMLLWLR